MKPKITIIGAGIMGLMTAYYCRGQADVTLYDISTVGNPKSASAGTLRSIRNDYIDPFYAQLAYESRKLWLAIQDECLEQFMFNCGCLNIGLKSLTPKLSNTYAAQAAKTLRKLKIPLSTKKFPQFNSDISNLDVEAGVLYPPAIIKYLKTVLIDSGVKIVENCAVVPFNPTKEITIIVAGMGTKDYLPVPLVSSPPPASYYFVPLINSKQFSYKKLPVFAYLDIGIYGHPIIPGITPGVKIGYYNPPKFNKRISNQEDFIAKCMPKLKPYKIIPVTEGCVYDLTPDSDFIIGKVNDFPNTYIGCGFNGTGFKFAPIVGKSLASLALGQPIKYDLSRFSPTRFNL